MEILSLCSNTLKPDHAGWYSLPLILCSWEQDLFHLHSAEYPAKVDDPCINCNFWGGLFNSGDINFECIRSLARSRMIWKYVSRDTGNRTALGVILVIGGVRW